MWVGYEKPKAPVWDGRVCEEFPAPGRRGPGADPGRHEAQFRLWLWLVSIQAFLF